MVDEGYGEIFGLAPVDEPKQGLAEKFQHRTQVAIARNSVRKMAEEEDIMAFSGVHRGCREELEKLDFVECGLDCQFKHLQYP